MTYDYIFGFANKNLQWNNTQLTVYLMSVESKKSIQAF